MQIKTNAKPFMKWAGGKGQLLSQLDDYLPARLQTEQFTYIEPFVGGGAMFFHVLQKFPRIKQAVINDVNADLIKAYRVIKDSPDKLIEMLKRMETLYLSLDDANRKEMFLHERDIFNRHDADDIQNTALLLFLNKTCFNGLFRVNRKGEFNVPFGKYRNPMICNTDVLLADSRLLNKTDVKITIGDFTSTSRFIDSQTLTFFYFDPPYRPLSETSSFTSYSKGDFNDDDQRRLAAFCHQISSDNCLWMLSNSDCSAKNPTDTFFEELYKDDKIERVYATRSINANPEKRGKLTELLIHSNYEITKKLLFKAI